jgi:hypothetical protein
VRYDTGLYGSLTLIIASMANISILAPNYHAIVSPDPSTAFRYSAPDSHYINGISFKPNSHRIIPPRIREPIIIHPAILTCLI